MKRTQTTTTKEYDNEGRLIRETIETVEEEDETGTIYPPTIPYIPPTIPQLPWYWYPTITSGTLNVQDDGTTVVTYK